MASKHSGMHYLLQGLRLIRQPGLRVYVIVPVLVSVLCFGGAIFGLFYWLDSPAWPTARQAAGVARLAALPALAAVCTDLRAGGVLRFFDPHQPAGGAVQRHAGRGRRAASHRAADRHRRLARAGAGHRTQPVLGTAQVAVFRAARPAAGTAVPDPRHQYRGAVYLGAVQCLDARHRIPRLPDGESPAALRRAAQAVARQPPAGLRLRRQHAVADHDPGAELHRHACRGGRRDRAVGGEFRTRRHLDGHASR